MFFHRETPRARSSTQLCCELSARSHWWWQRLRQSRLQVHGLKWSPAQNLLFPSSPAQPLPVLLHTNALGYVGTPACCFLLCLGAFCFTSLPRGQSPAWLPTHPTPFLWCRLQRHPSCGRLGSLFAVWLDEELSWEGVKSLRGLKTTPTGCTV